MPGSTKRRSKASDTNATLPKYLTAPKRTPSLLKTISSLSNPYDTRSDFTCEGGKQQLVNARTENYSPDNTTKGKAEPNCGETSWSTLDGKRPMAGIAYNAWDNVGQIHSQYRAPSQSTALTSPTGISSRPDARSASSSLAGGWSRQDLKRLDTQPAPSGYAGAWPKPVSFAA
jgi:hypothetical protein